MAIRKVINCKVASTVAIKNVTDCQVPVLWLLGMTLLVRSLYCGYMVGY